LIKCPRTIPEVREVPQVIVSGCRNVRARKAELFDQLIRAGEQSRRHQGRAP
jgi:hypothetical protein